MVFLAANVLAASAMVLVLRATGRFVALYAADDVVLPVLSLLQALVFRWWAASR
ncbi:MAG: hypothetical protein HY294_12910 [Candidatus Rokubacteria bacterium]|nr:hypothetical protein [Candidatus Rokubacteria bacterium]